ncbi:MAG: 8-oxoguanine deaminase [Chloroflexi bacterium]|nr:8-oxoguanine deaminase [Chloroflexota bacterium]
MASLLVRHARLLVTMDEERREIPDGGFYVEDGFIKSVSVTADLPSEADEILDFHNYIVLPGLINTHHHFYQTLTRVIPSAQDVGLFQWLLALYPIWANLRPEDIRISTQLALAELALSGCTTTSDHLYLFPNACRLDDEIEAAQTTGLRLHAARGSMSLGESLGGLPPDSVVETEEAILKDSQRIIETYHDPDPGSMLQIVVAPTSPFSVSPDLMKETAALARAYNVKMHTHLAETLDEEQFCLELYDHRPVALAESLDWFGSDVWFAHAVHVDGDEIKRMGAAGVGVAHCPTSNMRLASGIAPVERYMDAGVSVGLGVDGSASNDSSHMLAETRQAMLMARLGSTTSGSNTEDGKLFSARQALEIATLGGAKVLGREDIGALRPGMCADFIAINLERIEFAGALHDPVAALLFCHPGHVDHVYVHGKSVVKNGRFTRLDLDKLVAEHNQASKNLINRSNAR